MVNLELITSINNPNGKLRTYNLIKGDFNSDKYLNLVRNIKHRVNLSKFCLSNHRLLIEVGRHLKLPGRSASMLLGSISCDFTARYLLFQFLFHI